MPVDSTVPKLPKGVKVVYDGNQEIVIMTKKELDELMQSIIKVTVDSTFRMCKVMYEKPD